jgi:hypothetical protein
MIISELIWFSLYLHNTEVVLKEGSQCDIPQKIQVPRLVGRDFPERIPPTGRVETCKGVCSVLQEQ